MFNLRTSFIRYVFLAAALMMLPACGEVITPQPTVVTPSAITGASTPAPTASTPTLHPTATAPLLPLAATATPTITPTPVTHVVQEGETLLSIAYEYGVSLQALQTANGIENPLLLQIGQELVIPIGEETTETTPGLLLPTPTPLPFSVQAVAFYETPVGGLECLGEITNTTALTLTNVLVRVTLYDDAGAALMAGDAFAAADLIPSGTRSPFRILFTAPPATWASPQVTIIRGEAAGALAAAYVPITVTEVEGHPADSQFQVSGIVRNDSAEQTAGDVNIIVTTYDAQGRVTGFRRGTVEVESPLAPGATAPFTLLLTYHGDAPTDFNVVALSRITSD